MPRDGERARDEPGRAQAVRDAQVAAAKEATAQRIAKTNQKIKTKKAQTAAFEKKQQAFERQIEALKVPSDPTQFGQKPPDLSFEPTAFATPKFNRGPLSGVGTTKAGKQSTRADSSTAAFTLGDVRSKGVPRSTPRPSLTRKDGATTASPGTGTSPIQRVLGNRTRKRLEDQGRF